MAVAQPDIAKVKTIQVLDGCTCCQQERKVESYEHYISTGLAHLYYSYDAVRDAHLEFLRAGANVIRTNTFGASYLLLKQSLSEVNIYLTNYQYTINQSVYAAKEAIDRYVDEARVDPKNYWILGCCGSITRCNYVSVENLRPQMCHQFHAERIRTFVIAEINRLAFESIETETEAFAILNLLQRFSSVRAYMSFRCDENGRLSDGKDVAEVFRRCYLPDGKIFAVGVNCVSPMFIRDILVQINESDNTIPLVACPGNIYDIDESILSWQPIRNVGFAPANEWNRMNIRYIGGCCGTLPGHIRKIRDLLNEADERGSQLPQM